MCLNFKKITQIRERERVKEKRERGEKKFSPVTEEKFLGVREKKEEGEIRGREKKK